jgi:hypothetical protein
MQAPLRRCCRPGRRRRGSRRRFEREPLAVLGGRAEGWTAAMRPTPVMMPVNIRAYFRRFAPGRPGRPPAERRREAGALVRWLPQACRKSSRPCTAPRCAGRHPRSTAGNASANAWSSVAGGRNWPARRPCPAAGGQVEQELVHQAFAQERAVELVPASTCSSLTSRAPGRAAWRPDRPCRRGRAVDHGRARASRARARRLRAGACRSGSAGQRGRAGQQAGVQRRFQPAVHHHQMRLARRGTRRTSSIGSSSSTVPMPVSTAQARAARHGRRRVPRHEVIHWLTPLGRAVIAVQRSRHLHAHPGRPRTMRLKKPMFSSRAPGGLAVGGSTSTAMPAARSRSSPGRPPAGWGRPAWPPPPGPPRRTSASQQGGVRPWWEQGSSVT